MKLIVLGSSSKGNCYILDAGGTALVIECGVPLMEVKRALGYDISKVAGCLLSHSHGDHAKYVDQFLKAGIKVYTNDECLSSININSHNWHLSEGKYRVGDFMIQAHEVVHDVKCQAFLIRYQDNTIAFVTDTHYVPFVFRGLTNIIVECNYSGEILEERAVAGSIPMNVRNRVLSSHLSFETCRDFLMATNLKNVNNIVLIHLSDGNSDARRFRDEMIQATGCNVHIAKPGLQIPFDSKPF